MPTVDEPFDDGTARRCSAVSFDKAADSTIEKKRPSSDRKCGVTSAATDVCEQATSARHVRSVGGPALRLRASARQPSLNRPCRAVARVASEGGSPSRSSRKLTQAARLRPTDYAGRASPSSPRGCATRKPVRACAIGPPSPCGLRRGSLRILKGFRAHIAEILRLFGIGRSCAAPVCC
jgi:hypothetical protein